MPPSPAEQNPNREWQDWRSTAEELARNAGQLVRNLLAQPRQTQSKGFRDIVTDADLAAQALITGQLRQRYPSHGFWAEEENLDLPTGGPVRWLVDPVDGTSNYSRGIPNFCVSIAALVAEHVAGDQAASAQVVVGAIYDPISDDLFSAARGQGCTLNGQPMAVSATATVAEAAVAFDWGRQRAIRQRTVNAVPHFAHEVRTIRSFGSSALSLAWVACGRLDAYLSLRLGAWDIAAGTLLIEEAGGQVSTIEHTPLVMQSDTSCFASNGRLHIPLLTLMRGPAPK
jgi:myo-inositol-1(or 4)-monophosphatase